MRLVVYILGRLKHLCNINTLGKRSREKQNLPLQLFCPKDLTAEFLRLVKKVK